MLKLNIGSGPGFKHEEGVIGLDYIKDFKPDVVRDIRKGLPFDDNKFDKINCEHTLEHIQLNEDFIFVMNEIWRVLKPGGTVYIEVPHKDAESAYESIEHTRFFGKLSFVNFYLNPYAKEMGYPLFKTDGPEEGERNGHKTIKITLQK